MEGLGSSINQPITLSCVAHHSVSPESFGQQAHLTLQSRIQLADLQTDNVKTCSSESSFLQSHDAFQMSWNLLERFLESDHFNKDPSLTIQYLL